MGGPLRTRPGPGAVDGVGEGQALGKRRGLREDRRLRVRAIQSVVGGRRKQFGLREAHCAGVAGLRVGGRHAAGPVFFLSLSFFVSPRAQAQFSCCPRGLLGGRLISGNR